MYGFNKPQPPEIQILDKKAQTGIELANIIIEFLISEKITLFYYIKIN